MLGAGQQSASLTLNPPDLGPLKVVINVHNDQADTTFISDNDEVRKALESGMSHLRDKMSESGIQLGQANVSTSQQSQQEFQQAAQNRVNQKVKNQTNEPAVEGSDQARVTLRVSDGLVDTFA
jgi:flagellar hook-length control protein FliK